MREWFSLVKGSTGQKRRRCRPAFSVSHHPFVHIEKREDSTLSDGSISPAMPRHGQRTAEETGEAGSEAFKGAVVGAAKVGSSNRAPTRCRPWTLSLSSLSVVSSY